MTDPAPSVAGLSSSGDGEAIAVDLRALRPSDARRLLQIAWVLARHGVVGMARSGHRLVLRPRRQGARVTAVALRRAFADLGPTFVKLGQLIASSPGLFPSVLSDELRSLLDALPPEPPRRVRAVIERELDAPIGRLFAHFDDRAIAAASIAQVHEARLHNGVRVAVKVRRPHLRPRIERDLRLLYLLARGFERTGRLGEMANPRAIVEDFATTISAELDFRVEAAGMRRFRENLIADGHEARMKVPEAIEGMVTPRVLVMTYVEGKAIDLVASSPDRPDDLIDVMLEAVRVWLEGALRHGLFHGDVHAGNLFVDPPDTIAFLDFGIMGRLEDHTRRAITETLPAAIGPIVLQNQYERVRDVVDSLGVADAATTDFEALAEQVKQLVGVHLSRPLAQITYGDIMVDIIRLATRHRLRLPRELVLVAKQAIYFERYAKLIAPDLNLFERPDLLRFLLDGLVDPSLLDALPAVLALVQAGASPAAAR